MNTSKLSSTTSNCIINNMSDSFEKLPPEVVRKHKGFSFVGVTTCFVCHDGKGNIFMAKRTKNARDEHDRWDTGGGGLKFGNTAVDNVIMEVSEEYSAIPQEIKFLGYRDVFRESPNGAPSHWLALDFSVLVNREDMKINEPDVFDDSGWFTLDNLPSPLHSQLGFLLDKFKEQYSLK